MVNTEKSTYKTPSSRSDSSKSKVRVYFGMPTGYAKRNPLYNFLYNQEKYSFEEIARKMAARLLQDKNKFAVAIFYENSYAGYSGKEIFRVQGNLK